MSTELRYRGNTDRRFNDWHYTLPRDWAYIDLDGMEVCPRCWEPLLLYEQSRDPNKATSILANLARMAGLPAVLMILPSEPRDRLDDTVLVRWRFSGSRRWISAPLSAWREELVGLRATHDRMKHGRKAA